MKRSTCRPLAAAVFVLLALAGVAAAQAPNCGVLQGSLTTALPSGAGTIPNSSAVTTGYGDDFNWVLTQWGFAQTRLTTPSNPSPYTQIIIGKEGGSNSGIIQIRCDCHQGSNSMDVADDGNGNVRLVSDWQPYHQGGPPGSADFSGLPAQVAMTTSYGSPAFGNQIALPGAVALGARVAAIYTSAGKFFGYFPVANSNVYVADVSNPNGIPSVDAAITPSLAIGWGSGVNQGSGVRLRARHVSAGGYSADVLVGATLSDSSIHYAEINPNTGVATEKASAPSDGYPIHLEIAVVNGQIFVLAAESASGLQVYRYNPANSTLTSVFSIVGNFKQVEVSGPQPYPALFLYRDAGTSGSYIDIYDTKWLTDGGAPLLVRSLPHYGSAGVNYKGTSFEAYVTLSNGVYTAYIYRVLTPPPPGIPDTQSPVRTDKVDISCIAADPDAPPVATATMLNLSAQGRPSPENTKNYFGDRWQILDTSASSQPITNVAWDINTGASGPYAPDAGWSGNPATNPELSDINPAYWPCDPAVGGNLSVGTGCWGSLGGPASGTFYLGLKTTNVNGPSANTFFSPGVPVLSPNVSIVGFDGNTLSVLAGNPNNGDASASQGNTAEATFSWTFSPGNVGLSGTVVTVPTTATSFTLLATYKNGFSVTKGGSIQQVDLVPNFSLSPNPVLKSAVLTVKNLMQKAAAATLNSVTWAMSPSGGSGTLAASFHPVNGTATVSAPSAVGNYTIALTYSYTDHLGVPRTANVSLPFSVTDFSPVPSLGVYKDSAKNQAVFPLGNPPTFSLTTGTTYYLFDDETLPNGVPHPGAQFHKSADSNNSITTGDTLVGSTSNAGPQSFNPAACSGSCYIKATVSGTTRAFRYSASTPTGGGGGDPTLTLTGPSDGVVGIGAVFSASATDFAGTPAFTWDFGDAGGGGGGGGGGCPPIAPNCIAAPASIAPPAPQASGSSSATHVYTAANTYTVRVTASGGGDSRTASKSIVIRLGGPPPPSNIFTVSGATYNGLNNSWNIEAGQAVSFTASEPDPGATFAWDFGDSTTATGRTVTHAFTSQGTRTTTMIATGGGTATSGTSAGTARFLVAPPSFQALMIPGAGSILSEAGDWATDFSVTNPGTQATTITLYFASFADDIPEDLSTLPFDSLKSFRLDGGQSWSGVDVIGDPEILDRRGAGKGILLARFQGGNQVPIATARVYFTAQGSSYGTALPSFVTGPYGQSNPQAVQQAATGQTLVGLRNDALYRFNVSLFNASSAGGLFHLDVFSEDGVQVASRDFGVLPYSQAGVNDTDLFTPDPSQRYVIKASSTAGMLQAYASVLDRRNNDLVQVADDTPRIDVAPGTPVSYYVSGVGRIEVPETNTHWRTDLNFYNPSTLRRDLVLEYLYTPAGSTVEKRILAPLSVGPGQGVPLDDIVGNYLDDFTPDDLKTGTILGVLRVGYNAPTDIATAPVLIGGRIYADLDTGTAGMQLSTYTSDESVAPGNSVLVMPGAQANLRFRTNVGIFSQGDLPTSVRITAVRQDGTVASTFDYQLNNPEHTGAFAQIPITTDTFPGIDGNAMTIKVQSLSGSPVGAYIVTVDQISTDTVFIQGKRVN